MSARPSGDITVETLHAADMAAALEDLARLRIEVFRAFPYLYAGSLAYERAYLSAFAASPGGFLVVARAGARIVGAATASPLAHQEDAVTAPFRARGEALEPIMYFGESVLLAEHRGQGIGHRFFDQREAVARAAGCRAAAFCAVIRPPDHPRRPPGYRPLDDFWRKRGYAPDPGLIASFSWRDVGDAADTAKPMQFWRRRL